MPSGQAAKSAASRSLFNRDSDTVVIFGWLRLAWAEAQLAFLLRFLAGSGTGSFEDSIFDFSTKKPDIGPRPPRSLRLCGDRP